MEQRNENPMFGRKVFFITPNIRFEKFVIDGLREQEYECYAIHDYKVAKHILRQNKDALAFINIDEGLHYDEWFKFIKSFDDDPELSTIFIGIISESPSEKRKNFFIMNSRLPGGFVMANVPLDRVLTQIQGILDVNGAKGVRQYIRLDCTNNSRISSYLTHGARIFPIEIDNISTAGIAFSVSKAMAPVFVKGAVVPNISISIDRKTIVVTGVIFKANVTPDDKCYAIMMLVNLKLTEKQLIRDLIFSTLENKFKEEQAVSLIDNTDYKELELKGDDAEALKPIMDLSLFEHDFIGNQIIEDLFAM